MAPRSTLTLVIPLIAAALLAGCGSPRQKPPAIPDSERFVMLGADGQPTSEPNAPRCVYDRRTRLVWELKPGDDALHRGDHTYTWYSSSKAAHMSEPGTPAGGRCPLQRCDTEALVAAVNAEGWCGASDWRLPSREESITLGDRRQIPSGLALDPQAFASIAPAEYWTGSTFRLYPQSAWAFDTRTALDRADWKYSAKPVWLVRGPLTAAPSAAAGP